MRHPLLTLALAVALVAAARQAATAALPKDAPIAVIGGGVSGLFLATLLSEAGYSDITIFEAADQIAPISCTAMVEGDAYDCSIVGVQTGGTTIEASSKLMKRANVTWELVPPNQVFFDSNTGEQTVGGVLAVVDSWNETQRAEAEEEMMRMLEVFDALQPYPQAPYGIIQSGVVWANESFGEWCERNSMPYTLELATPLYYTYGYSEVALVPAALVVDDLGSLVLDTLYMLGVRPNAPGMPPSLSEAMADCGKDNGTYPDCISTMHPREGMRAFFESLEQSLPASVKVRKSVAVVHIRPLPGGGAELSYDAAGQPGKQEFEGVVLAVRPSAALQMLPPDHPASELYASFFTGLNPRLRTQLYQFMVWSLNPSAAKQNTVGGELLADGGANPFTAGFVPYGWDQQVNGTMRSAFYPWPGGKGISAIAFIDTVAEPNMTASVAYNQELLARLGFPLGRVQEAGTWRPMYPDTVRMDVQREVDVFSAFEALQGKGGMFYTGELLNGMGVPVQAMGVQALMDAHFS